MNTIKLNTIGERPIKKSGASGGGGGGNYVYYSGTMRDFSTVLSLASMAKVAADSGIIYYPMGMALYPDTFTSETNIIGAGFDLSMKISHPVSGELTTVGDVLTELGVDWTQITEEEFYDTKIPMCIDFRGWQTPNGINLNKINFKYDEGMTWREWLSSPYNTLAEIGFPLSFKEEEGYEPYLGGFTEQGMPYYLNSPADARYVLADDIIVGQVYQIHFLG